MKSAKLNIKKVTWNKDSIDNKIAFSISKDSIPFINSTRVGFKFKVFFCLPSL